MAPGSAIPCENDARQKMFSVVSETQEQTKVMGTYATEEEAYLTALQNQVGVFKAIKEKMLPQVLGACPDQSLEWKLKMLQEAMEAFFQNVGSESLTDFFYVTDQEVSVSDTLGNKRKMFADLRGAFKLAKLNSSCGVASTLSTVSSMSAYMYETLPFGGV